MFEVVRDGIWEPRRVRGQLLLLLPVGKVIVFGVVRDGTWDPRRVRGQLLGLLAKVFVKLIWDDRREALALEVVVFIW